jgi:hypothetical protein
MNENVKIRFDVSSVSVSFMRCLHAPGFNTIMYSDKNILVPLSFSGDISIIVFK